VAGRREQADFSDDAALVAALRAGDDAAFGWLLHRYDATLRRLARSYVATDAVADDVVQDTWMGVIRGIDGFEHRSSVKTWIVRILMNVARTRGVREARTVPLAGLGAAGDASEATFPSDRFLAAGHDQWPGHWRSFPLDWETRPDERLLARETLAEVAAALDRLPPAQRDVVVLRDLEGWSSDEVCVTLDVSETNQRVLLHRGRAKVRQALEPFLARAAERGES
jgi:RNA polymerase sigma-70 factor (ECF subfamily)